VAQALTNTERQRRWRERQPKHPRAKALPAPEAITPETPLVLSPSQLRRRQRREVEYIDDRHSGADLGGESDAMPQGPKHYGPGAADIIESAEEREIRLRLPNTLPADQVPPEVRESRDEHRAEMLAELGAVTTRIQQEPFSRDTSAPVEPSTFTNGHRLAPEGAVESWQRSDGYRLGTVRRFSRDGGMTVRRVTGLKVLR